MRSRARSWGWGLSLLIGSLVLLNGVAWWFMGGSLATFEGDTGVALDEFRAACPTAAEQIGWLAGGPARPAGTGRLRSEPPPTSDSA